MIPIIGSSSTRNKLHFDSKHVKSARYFKKLITDEN